MATKKAHNRRKLIDFIANPENEFPNRGEMSVDVLGYTDHTAIYQYFTPVELDEIEAEAFEVRKRRSVKRQSEVFAALHKSAKGGDVAAAKEWLNRVVGKVVEVREVAHSGEFTIKQMISDLDGTGLVGKKK